MQAAPAHSKMVQLSEAKPFDIARFVFSLALLLFSGVVTCYSIVEQKTSMWKEVSCDWWKPGHNTQL